MVKKLFPFIFGLMLFVSSAFGADLTLNWVDNSNNESGFNVERGTTSTGPFSQIATPAANATSYVDSNLPAAHSFCYRVNAFNDSGVSPYTNVACSLTKAILTVTKAGTGIGTVDAPTGINCGTVCSASYDGNSTVTITAAPAAGSAFTGWSGACTGVALSCTIAMNNDLAATATFTSLPVPAAPSGLTVTTK